MNQNLNPFKLQKELAVVTEQVMSLQKQLEIKTAGIKSTDLTATTVSNELSFDEIIKELKALTGSDKTKFYAKHKAAIIAGQLKAK